MKYPGLGFPLWMMLIAWAGCSSPATRAEKEQDRREKVARDLKDELEMGRQIAAKLSGTFKPLENHPQALRYVNLVGGTVAAQSSRPEIAYRFGILRSEDVNAFATPGGYVFVTTGLLKELRSEEELAAVLGHEIAHVTERHMYKEIMPEREFSAGETLTRFLSRGGSDFGKSITQLVNQGLDMLLETGLGIEKESEADSVGLMYAHGSGYDPAALLDLLTRLEKKQAGGERLAKTHPPFPERLKNLRAAMRKNGLVSGTRRARTDVMRSRFERFQAELTDV